MGAWKRARLLRSPTEGLYGSSSGKQGPSGQPTNYQSANSQRAGHSLSTCFGNKAFLKQPSISSLILAAWTVTRRGLASARE